MINLCLCVWIIIAAYFQDSSNPPPVFNTKAPENLNFVTWNIDGLDHKNLKIRTKAVYKLIAQFKIDIVCLQEVIPESYNYLKTKLPEYQFLCENPEAEYFTVVLLRRFVVYLDSFISIDFPGSRMGRKLFLVDCHVGKFKLCILNTHLESTKDHAQERMTQLRQCFKTALDQPETTTVLLAGDLNMRDKELAEVGGAPVGMEDLWIRTGSRKECQFTWDMTRNTNLEVLVLTCYPLNSCLSGFPFSRFF